MRQVTFSLLKDERLRLRFAKMGRFHHVDLEEVYDRYISRVETMVGNEVARHCMEALKKSEIALKEQLRVVKTKRAAKVKQQL